MTTGGTVEELNIQVDTLVGEIVAECALIQDLEQQAVAGTADADVADVIAVHRQIVTEHRLEVILLRAEIAQIPRQRQPGQ